MVGDDPLDVGVVREGALSQHARLVRLDAEAQVDDRVDVRVGGDELHDGGDRVAGLAAGQVDGVVARPARWEVLVDLREQVLRQRHQLEVAVAGDRVRGHHPPTAGGGHDHDPVARRQRLGRERRGGLERLFDVGGAGDARLTAGPVEGGVVGGQRAGVARRGARTARGGAALHHDDGHLCGDAAQRVVEAPPLADALDVGQRDGRAGVGRVVLQEVGNTGRGRVARGDRTRDPDAGGARPVHEARHEVARLRRDGDATRRRVRGDDLGAHRRRGRHHALPVRADEQDAELGTALDELVPVTATLGACLAVARRGQERGLHALGGGRGEQVEVRPLRGAHEDQVRGALGQLVERPQRLDAEHLLALEVRGVEPALVPRGDDVVQADEAELAGVRRGAGDDDAGRVEQRGEVLRGVRRSCGGAHRATSSP